MGSIYKRGDVYWVKYRDRKTRKLVRRSAGRTRLEALAALRRAGEEASSGGSPFETLAQAYLSHLRVHAKRKSVQVAESSTRRLLDHFAGKDARSLSLVALDSFILSRKGNVKAVTINGDLITLRAILNHAVRARLLDSLPIKVRLLKAPRKRVLPILSTDDLRKLLGHASEPYYGILFICAHTGFRLSETLHLTWSDVLFDEGKLAVTSKDGWESKTYEERSVYVPETLLAYLKTRWERTRYQGVGDYIFATSNGTPLGTHNVCRAMRGVFKRAGFYRKGMPLTHWIRHSVCSRLLGEGVDVETVRQILGHADATTTLRYYAHTSEERMRSASSKLRL